MALEIYQSQSGYIKHSNSMIAYLFQGSVKSQTNVYMTACTVQTKLMRNRGSSVLIYKH